MLIFYFFYLEPKVTVERCELVLGVVEAFLDGHKRDQCEVPELFCKASKVTTMEMPNFNAILKELEEENVIMTREGTVYLI